MVTGSRIKNWIAGEGSPAAGCTANPALRSMLTQINAHQQRNKNEHRSRKWPKTPDSRRFESIILSSFIIKRHRLSQWLFNGDMCFLKDSGIYLFHQEQPILVHQFLDLADFDRIQMIEAALGPQIVFHRLTPLIIQPVVQTIFNLV